MRGIGKAFDVSAICPSLLAQLSAHSSYSRWFRHLGKPELWELAIKELLAFLTRWTFQTNQSSKTRHVMYARNVLSIQRLSCPFIQKATIQIKAQIQIQIRYDRKRSANEWGGRLSGQQWECHIQMKIQAQMQIQIQVQALMQIQIQLDRKRSANEWGGSRRLSGQEQWECHMWQKRTLALTELQSLSFTQFYLSSNNHPPPHCQLSDPLRHSSSL